MGKKSVLIDNYILKVEPFAQEILNHLRDLVHIACPEVEEKIKWGFPHFDSHGAMMCHMAAFKKHCAFGFWKGEIMTDPNKIFLRKEQGGMGHLGKLTTIKNLPNGKTLVKYIKEAAYLNKENIKLPAKEKVKTAPLQIPDYLQKALAKNLDAKSTFEKFSPSCKNEYVQWIVEAKTEATRLKRITQAVEWMADGKIRNWKYIKK